jgi:hypothetical protein
LVIKLKRVQKTQTYHPPEKGQVPSNWAQFHQWLRNVGRVAPAPQSSFRFSSPKPSSEAFRWNETVSDHRESLNPNLANSAVLEFLELPVKSVTAKQPMDARAMAGCC